MRWFSIVASLVLACAISAELASPVAAAQASSAAPAGSASTTSKSTTHKKKHHYVKRQPSQKAPTADRITEIQSALSKGGYYQGQPSGKWDSNTVAAVQKFQSANGIEANGKLDAATLQKLGLGSDIAGVSAPKRAPPPSCCSTAPATLVSPPSTQTSPPTGGPVASVNSTSAASDAKSSAH